MRFHEIHTPVNGTFGVFSDFMRWKCASPPCANVTPNQNTDAFADTHGNANRNATSDSDTYA